MAEPLHEIKLLPSTQSLFICLAPTCLASMTTMRQHNGNAHFRGRRRDSTTATLTSGADAETARRLQHSSKHFFSFKANNTTPHTNTSWSESRSLDPPAIPPPGPLAQISSKVTSPPRSSSSHASSAFMPHTWLYVRMETPSRGTRAHSGMS